MSQLVLQVLTIVLAARAAGWLFRRVGQPAVVGEMIAGIALGPSVLGALAPGAAGFLFPPEATSHLFTLSQLGILLYMFVVGMDLDTKLLRERAPTAVAISQASIAVPFVLGAGAAWFLLASYAPPGVAFHTFALFVGISMSITAFPVLARILQERGLTFGPLGTTALACAAVDDVTAWCGLAFISAIARAQGLTAATRTLALTVLFIAVVLGVARPLLRRLPAAGSGTLVAGVGTALACALCAEEIGIHLVFGAFVAGVAMPRSPELRTYLRQRIESLSSLFLLPLFFAFTGLRTQVGLLSGAADWGVCLGLLGIAVAGKLGTTAVAARASGFNWGDSARLGALMNTRGLVELIALNMGLELGVLTPKLFTMLVLMALVTTFATGPLLSLLRPRSEVASPIAESRRGTG